MKGVQSLAANVLEAYVEYSKGANRRLIVDMPSDLFISQEWAGLVAMAESYSIVINRVRMPRRVVLRLPAAWAITWFRLRRRPLSTLVWVDYSVPLFLPKATELVVHFTDLNHFSTGTVPRWRPRRIVRQIIIPRLTRRARLVLPISERSKRELLSEYDCLGRVVVWPLFCRPIVRSAARSRREDAHRGGSWKLVMVGSLNPHKRHDLAVRAVSQLVQDGLDVRLDIVGLDTGRGSEIDRLSKSLGMDARIMQHGAVDDDTMLDLIRSADIFVQASDYEGFGLSVLEAIALGLPCVVSDIEAHREVAGDSCHYFAPGDACDLATVLRGVVGCAKLTSAEGAGVWTVDAAASLLADVLA